MSRQSLLLLSASLLFAACKVVPPAMAPAAQVAPPAPSPAEGLDRAAAVQQLMQNFSLVHFALDSSALDAASKRLLVENAGILLDHPDLRVEVQGHSDERGTTDYNVALGMRRADAVRQALTAMGVAPSRVVTISFGEERPIANGADEVAWAQNRRAEFRVLTPTAAVTGTTGV